MESSLLRIFVAVAEKKSITLAAKRLNVSQTNVSLRIKHLEENLGYSLFHRMPKGIVLTKEGTILLPYAQEVIKKLHVTESVMKNIHTENSLIVASTFSNARMRLVPFVKKITSDFPNLKMELVTNNTQPITKLLLDYEVDIAFVNHKPEHEDLMILNTFDNELLLIEPLQDKDEFLDKKTIIGHQKTCAFFNGLKQYYEYLGINDYEVLEISDSELMLAYVELGLGTTLLPRLIVEKFGYLDKVKTTVISSAIIDIPTCLICRKDSVSKINTYLKKMIL